MEERRQLNHEDHVFSGNKYQLSILLHNFESPMNVGSIFRLADALGVEKIYLSGSSPVPPNSKIKKTSRSAEKYVPFEYKLSPYEIVNDLKKNDYSIVCLELAEGSVDIATIKFDSDSKICLIVGSENKGVDQELIDLADCLIHIPMEGNNSSMNVATASAIAVYEMAKMLR